MEIDILGTLRTYTKVVKLFHRSNHNTKPCPNKYSLAEICQGLTLHQCCDGKFRKLVPLFFTFCGVSAHPESFVVVVVVFLGLSLSHKRRIFSFSAPPKPSKGLGWWYLLSSAAVGIERGLLQWILLVTEWSLTINTEKWHPKQRGFHCEHMSLLTTSTVTILHQYSSSTYIPQVMGFHYLVIYPKGM